MEKHFIILQNVNELILGYKPSGSGSTSPQTITVGGITATKEHCVKWEMGKGGNGHSYCGYKVPTGQNLDFAQAFNFAQAAKGYMITLTSTEEWDFVKKEVILGTRPLNGPIWIGYTALKTPGNPYEYRWITNESWRNNWGNDASTQSFFATNQPAAAGEGLCTLISASGNREWFSQNCDAKVHSGTNINSFIIEFDQ